MYIIGITGGTGSGKTSIANMAINSATDKNVALISQDAYYKERNVHHDRNASCLNFDHPDSIDFKLLASHLQALKNGQTIKQPVYDFKNHNRTSNFIITKAKKVIILEGILILSNAIIRNLIDFKVFIEADADIRLARRIKRDIKERGRDVNNILQRYTNTIKPMHEMFIEPNKCYADLIMPNNTYNTKAGAIINAIIKEQL